MTPDVAVFDIGEVLVRWKPHLAWADEFATGEEAEAFMARIGFHAFNARADHGERFAELATEIAEAQDARLLADYPTRHIRTIREPVAGTWALIDRLLERGVRLHAITNWSDETWAAGLEAHPRLAEIFGTVIVSGTERIAKPDPRIYRLLCERADVGPENCVFIDDKPENIDGARAIGMDAIHFTGADALEVELTGRGLL